MGEKVCKWCGVYSPTARVLVGDLEYHPTCAVDYLTKCREKAKEDGAVAVRRAVAAETERCAQSADSEQETCLSDPGDSMARGAAAARRIAMRIRDAPAASPRGSGEGGGA